MKKSLQNIFLLCLLVCIFPQKVSAQFKAIRPETFWGGSLGGTFSSVSFTPSLNTKTKGGITAGISFRYIAEEYVGLLLELNYSQIGWKEEFENEPHEYERTLNYLQFPAFVHIYFGKQKTRFFVNLGPQINFLLGEKEEANFPFDGSVKNNRSYQQYGKDVEHKVDYGLTAGAGLELRTKVGCFLLEGRYFLGLGDIFETDMVDPFSGSAHRVMSVKLSYLFQVR